MEACSGFGIGLQLSWDAEGSGARVQGPGWRVWSAGRWKYGSVRCCRGVGFSARCGKRFGAVLHESSVEIYRFYEVDPIAQNPRPLNLNPKPLNPQTPKAFKPPDIAPGSPKQPGALHGPAQLLLPTPGDRRSRGPKGLGFRGLALGFRGLGIGFRVLGLGFRDC